MKDYEEYMNSLAWKNKRVETFKLKGFKCQRCSSDRNLHIHHATYDRFTEENVETDLFVLCMYCHDVYHQELSIKFKRTTIEETKHFIENREPTKLEEGGWDRLQEVIREQAENGTTLTKRPDRQNVVENIVTTKKYYNYNHPISKRKQKKIDKQQKDKNLKNAMCIFYNK